MTIHYQNSVYPTVVTLRDLRRIVGDHKDWEDECTVQVDMNNGAISLYRNTDFS